MPSPLRAGSSGHAILLISDLEACGFGFSKLPMASCHTPLPLSFQWYLWRNFRVLLEPVKRRKSLQLLAIVVIVRAHPQSQVLSVRRPERSVSNFEHLMGDETTHAISRISTAEALTPQKLRRVARPWYVCFSLIFLRSSQWYFFDSGVARNI